ncbi:LOW QUALITY PROTEIN: UBN2 domain-containing protein [Cephalotus follicularis]|uniref:UBN2 domain-containing protein n=1 Tax=Cephalotus follicularis TaxID=3775 RepID=A0A1Q3BMR5_CEPFO|nr:LOW QUALITY PROTEIN: UBN2 domain-containing protein [Cephalotus follicularis]
MTFFIQSLDYNLWDLIVDGPNLATTRNENGEAIRKPRSSYNDDDRKRVQMNAKAKHIIICAISFSEFNRVSFCVSTKEMWDRLEVTYEGTNQVKEATTSMLVHDYKMTMNENEDIKSMFTRFTNIINALQALDKTYSNSEMDLLGSLMTHELLMQKKDYAEEKEKKKENGVALKSSTIEDSDDDDDD